MTSVQARPGCIKDWPMVRPLPALGSLIGRVVAPGHTGCNTLSGGAVGKARGGLTWRRGKYPEVL